MKKNLLIFCFVSLLTITAYSQENLLLRFPSINQNGSTIAFSYQGDIWTVPATGGRPVRLTVHEGYESNPIFSPDGQTIAFTGNRFGNNDIFTIPTDGGAAKRLTWSSASDLATSWTNDNKIIFTTSREFRQIERDPEIYAIAASGGTEQRMADVLGFEPTPSPNGKFVAFVTGGSNPVAREDYLGTANREIWIMDTKTKKL
jgi:tricorn protease